MQAGGGGGTVVFQIKKQRFYIHSDIPLKWHVALLRLHNNNDYAKRLQYYITRALHRVSEPVSYPT